MLTLFAKKPVLTLTFFTIILLFAVISLSPSSPFSQIPLYSAIGESDIWSAKRILEWRPCKWWLQGHLTGQSVEWRHRFWDTTNYITIPFVFFVLKCCSSASRE